MLAFTGSRISAHMSRDNAGALICHAVPIAREGWQEYRASEVGIEGGDDSVRVYRPPHEVFSKSTMASFEGKPVTDDHPGTFLTPENWSAYCRGHVQNVRVGETTDEGERTLVADLVINDRNLIEKIRNGKREVSCGYDCFYLERADGTFQQSRIRGNHVAVVAQGRAGENVRIMDGRPRKRMTEEEKAVSILRAIMAQVADQDLPTEYDERSAVERVEDAIFEQRLRAEIEPDLEFGKRAREIGERMRVRMGS